MTKCSWGNDASVEVAVLEEMPREAGSKSVSLLL